MAALAGGITMVLAMPNTTNPPLTDHLSFEQIDALASAKSCCDFALYGGATSTNAASIASIGDRLAGLKMYLNDTFNALRLDSVVDWMKASRY